MWWLYLWFLAGVSGLAHRRVSLSLVRNSSQSGYEAYQHPILQYATSVVVQASLGNQTLGLMPDTGSFDVLISSVLCEKCSSKKYRTTESKNFRISSPLQKSTFHFGPGDVTALRAYDSFVAGPFEVAKMPLWLISGISPGLYEAFATPEFDGLLGLGLSRSSAAEEMGVQSYSFCLQTFVSSWFSSGFLHWNGRDNLNFLWSEPIQSTDDFHWQLAPREVTLGTEDFCNGRCSAVLDSGTSILAAPSSVAVRLERSLPEVPANCSLEGLPSLTMQLTGGRKIIFPPSAYVMKLHGNYREFDSLALDGSIVWRRPKTNSTSSEACAPIFQITRSGHWILGLPFFRQYAVHFDRREKAMSFATNTGGTCGSGSSLSVHKHQGAHSALGVVAVDAADLSKALKRRE
eukprot:gnl/MRDRNA2_/MRDRNA2_147703_c0_seq1.p1 gnl/MRDRNA2_/MRDRNA2_147703_c0~~gnl/MRDRNA2_/MRDRNA2_147703_c0_seq1.p1  ORF type:complete len:404 (-),score=47.44 gnl/MRDRNA2_/MRDRNA2_147703_c0_seq1:44-1255(-)